MSMNDNFCEDQCPDDFDDIDIKRDYEQNGNRHQSPNDRPGEYIAKLRGLPWGATQNEILKFFDDCEVLNDRNGVHIIMSRDNRPSGDAFIEFASSEDLEKALKKDRCHMGSRYIEGKYMFILNLH